MAAVATFASSATRSRRRMREALIRGWFFCCALASVLTSVGILYVLISEALPFFGDVDLGEFFTHDKWSALVAPYEWGVLPLIAGTIQIAVGAAIVAIPLGTATAIFLSEYASPRLRGVIKPALEVLAGIPTIVYGFFAVSFITPQLREVFGADNISIYNGLSGSIVVGVMIIPMIASLTDDALRAVPRSLRDAGYALGATRMEVSLRIVVPAALSGMFASFVLAISRAIGETMAVTLACGATPRLTLDPTESIQTMTAFIVQISTGEASQTETRFKSLFAVGLVLFGITLLMNLAAHKVMRRFREVYE